MNQARLLFDPGIFPGFSNEIVVESPVRVDLGTCTSDACFVIIEFTETPTDPVAVKNGSTEFSRVTEPALSGAHQSEAFS